jgi:hypothetical protein
MLKVTILVCSICAGAGGTALWLKSGPSPSESGTMAMPSIQELHLQAGAASLPDRTIKEAY